MAFLKRANGETAGQIIELKVDRVVIGRSPEHCHVVLDPNGVSRRHAEIYRKAEEFYLSDLNSRNMTKVNNTKVIPGVDHRLAPGDRINICDVEFLFYPRLPSEGSEKDPGNIMIVNEGDSQDSPSSTRSTPPAPAPWPAWSSPRSSSRRSWRSPEASPTSCGSTPSPPRSSTP